jgi:tyrosine decarboxylase / aspartate 1-decarboxylase
LGLRARVVRVTPEWVTDVDAVVDAITDRTACVVAIAGSTEHGTVDDVPGIAAACRDHDVPLHVDAAWGGFVIPFARELGVSVPDFDFTVPGVATMTVDPHKMGLAPIPSGVMLTRDARDLDRIGIPSPYVSVEKQPTIQGTRPGAAPAATYAVMRHLGRDGYVNVVRQCLDTTAHLASALRKIGVTLTREPVLNLVSFHVRDPLRMRAKLAEKGFLVSLAPLSQGLKIVVMPHVTREAVDAFLPVLEETLQENGEI